MRELKTELIYEVPKKGIKSVIDDPTQPLYTNDGEREERRSVNGSAAHNGGLTRLLLLFLGATAGRTERTQEMERAGAISKCQEGEDERGCMAREAGKTATKMPGSKGGIHTKCKECRAMLFILHPSRWCVH